MTVNLSAFAGAGAQFFTGNTPLAGGLIYTYAAGTTTPTTTYTTSLGNVANSNPIVLDSDGRTTDEIWLTEGTVYKFVLKTSTGVQIGSYDNISGINDFTVSSVNSAANINFIQAGIGAVTRSVQAKLRDVVSVMDFGAVGNGSSDDTAAIQAALSSGAALVIVPFNANIRITSEITVPAGVSLQIDGQVSGTGRITCAGSTRVFGAGSVTCGNSWAIKLTGGDCVVENILINKASVYGILILPTATITSLRIYQTRIKGCQYGILRNNNSGIACYDALITDNVIEECTGDGIEWNVAYNDRRVKISDNLIQNINGSVTNSGIGIGVAGNVFTNTNDLTNYVQSISITDNYIRGARQGIHTETTAKCKISGNHISDITSSYGHSSIGVYGIISYAAVQTTISDNELYDCDAGISMQLGVISSTYTGSTQDCAVSNNFLVGCGIYTQAATYTGSSTNVMLSVKGNTIIRSAFQHAGVCNLIIDGNTIKSAAGSNGFILDYYSALFGGNYQYQYRWILKITNNQVFDELNRANVSISNVAYPSGFDGNFCLLEFNNSFALGASDVNDRGVTRIVYTNEPSLSGVPYGVEYSAGTLVVDTATPARYLVTVGGSRNRASDTYAVVDAANGIIRSTSLIWTSGSHHLVGQAITLTDGVITPVTGFVNRVYIASSQYRIDVVNSAGAPLNLGSLGAGTITSTNALTAVAV